MPRRAIKSSTLVRCVRFNYVRPMSTKRPEAAVEGGGASAQPASSRGRIARLSPVERKRIAALGAAARWGKKRAGPAKQPDFSDIEPDRAILLAATRIFAAGGYDRPTLRQIADDAGVGLQTIYRYYPTKRDLYLSCCANLLDRYMEYFDALVEGNGAVETKLYALALGLAETHIAPDLTRLIHRELLDPGSDLINRAYGSELRPHFELYFEAARELKVDDAAERIVAMISMIMGAVQFMPVSDLLRSVDAMPRNADAIAQMALRVSFPDIAWSDVQPRVTFTVFTLD